MGYADVDSKGVTPWHNSQQTWEVQGTSLEGNNYFRRKRAEMRSLENFQIPPAFVAEYIRLVQK